MRKDIARLLMIGSMVGPATGCAVSCHYFDKVDDAMIRVEYVDSAERERIFADAHKDNVSGLVSGLAGAGVGAIIYSVGFFGSRRRKKE